MKLTIAQTEPSTDFQTIVTHDAVVYLCMAMNWQFGPLSARDVKSALSTFEAD